METILGTFHIITIFKLSAEKLAYMYIVQLSCVYWQNIDSEEKELFFTSKLKLKSKFIFLYLNGIWLKYIYSKKQQNEKQKK